MRIHYPGFGRLFILIFLMNILGAQILHESGHWTVMQLFGRKPLWGITSLVQLSEREPASPEDWVELTNTDGSVSWLHLESLPASDVEWVLFLAAGPLLQLAAVVTGLVIFRNGRTSTVKTMGFLLAFVNAFGGLFYQLGSLLRGGGSDEKLIGQYLDISHVVISVVMAVCFGIGLVITLQAVEGWKTRLKWLAAVVVATFPVGPLLMISNGIIIEQVDAGNPLFCSALGFSLPVFLTGLVCLTLLVLAAYRWDFSRANGY
jgi:hypothetical protein